MKLLKNIMEKLHITKHGEIYARDLDELSSNCFIQGSKGRDITVPKWAERVSFQREDSDIAYCINVECGLAFIPDELLEYPGKLHAFIYDSNAKHIEREFEVVASEKSDLLYYKGYYARPKFSVDDAIFYGRILGIGDLVNFESENSKELESEFHKAVDDYPTCRKTPCFSYGDIRHFHKYHKNKKMNWVNEKRYQV